MSTARAARTRRIPVARAWHALTAVLCTASLLLQLMLSATADNESLPIRLGRLISFFTIQSNLIVAIVSWSLVRDPARDGRGWRVARLAAVVCITVTGVVYVTVLRGLAVLTPAGQVADTGLHYVTPALVLLGWLLFGPRPRIDVRSIAVALIFPVGWLAFTLARGAATGWYPYPFVDADAEGYAAVAVNCVFVTATVLAVSGLLRWLDRRLPAEPAPEPGYGVGVGR